jgi:hypothetical protein
MTLGVKWSQVQILSARPEFPQVKRGNTVLPQAVTPGFDTSFDTSQGDVVSAKQGSCKSQV